MPIAKINGIAIASISKICGVAKASASKFNGQTIVSYLLRDLFTDTNGTTMASHTLDSGGSWSGSTSNIEVQSNRAVLVSPSGVYRTIYKDCSTANISGEMVSNRQYTSGAIYGESLMRFRHTNDDNNWAAIIYQGDGHFYLQERTAGVVTNRDSDTTSAKAVNTDFTITITASGDNIDAWVNGGQQLTYSSTSHNSVTTHGCALLGAGAGTKASIDYVQYTAA